MEKYREWFNNLLKPKRQDNASLMSEDQRALVRAQFSTHEREFFFNDAYAEILSDYFVAWLKTPADDISTREHLYHCAMALGSVKQKLIAIETKGNNIPFLQQQAKQQAKPSEDTENGI